MQGSIEAKAAAKGMRGGRIMPIFLAQASPRLPRARGFRASAGNMAQDTDRGAQAPLSRIRMDSWL